MNPLHSKSLWVGAAMMAMTGSAQAHPHVFIEANIELNRNAAGAFTEVRHVWRFDELFSATIILDFDENGDSVLDESELKKVTSIVKESIAEYDFYTALRQGAKEIAFYEPEALNAYYEDGRLIMFLSLELEKPLLPKEKPLRVSASDTSYYVAFDFDESNISISGNSEGCGIKVIHPDFDKLYADNSLSLTETFFDNPENAGALGDEFYSWATISCS